MYRTQLSKICENAFLTFCANLKANRACLIHMYFKLACAFQSCKVLCSSYGYLIIGVNQNEISLGVMVYIYLFGLKLEQYVMKLHLGPDVK